MTVRELLARLEGADPEATVLIDHNTYAVRDASVMANLHGVYDHVNDAWYAASAAEAAAERARWERHGREKYTDPRPVVVITSAGW